MKRNKYITLSDNELLNKLNDEKHSSDEAFRALYNRYGAKVHAYCMRVLNNRDQAEDIFQETFIRFYEHARIDKRRGTVSGFLITIARNLCLNYKRDMKKTIPFEEFHLTVDEDAAFSKFETQKLIKLALDLLEFEYREPLVLRLYDGMSYKEISEICGISQENARARVFRAKQKIKAALEPHYKDLYK